MDNSGEAKRQTYWRLLKYVKPYWFRMTMGILAGFVVGGSLFGSLMLVPSLMSGIEFSGGGGNEKKVSAQEIVAAVRNSPGEAAGVAKVQALLEKPKSEETSKIRKELEKANKTLRHLGLSAFQLVYDHGNVRLEKSASKQELLTFPAETETGKMTWQFFTVFCVGFVFLWCIKNLATYVNHYLTRWVGTRVVADLSVRYGTRKFVMVSTDKAVNPTNVMGCSKRICEIYVQSLDKAVKEGRVPGATRFVTTRFGNVLGSNGSVIPLFREQIRRGGPVTVTHKDIIRYFMLIPEACKLVLEAGTMGEGGEIFVFDMGKPVRIVDLAERMIRLSGAKGVRIEFTGLRDGEKLYEEVLNDQETTLPTFHPKIKIARVREYDYDEVCRQVDELVRSAATESDMEIVRRMKAMVPEFKSQHSVYEALDK